jgi:hypothetical protein
LDAVTGSSVEADAASKNEQVVEAPNPDAFIGFEGTQISEHVDEGDGNATVNVQDEGIFLRRCHLNSEHSQSQACLESRGLKTE